MRQVNNFLGGTGRLLYLIKLQAQCRGKEGNNESQNERRRGDGTAGNGVAAAQRHLPMEGPRSDVPSCGTAPGSGAPGGNPGVSCRGLAAAPGAPRAAAVEAELRSMPAQGRGDRAGPGGLPAAGQPRGWRGQQDFVGLYRNRRKGKANFPVGEASGTGSHAPRRSIPGSPGKPSAPAFPEPLPRTGRGPRCRHACAPSARMGTKEASLPRLKGVPTPFAALLGRASSRR
ncbi:collagen alpha-1(IV) chain-like [Zonotrichia leucophrys gambelii]|uniref:collagen alpha-1(IV) chain-like n=1 Tax=Zonotrichia leucophrys gambelii TaxID=257770 RepID=UPI00313FE9BE